MKLFETETNFNCNNKESRCSFTLNVKFHDQLLLKPVKMTVFPHFMFLIKLNSGIQFSFLTYNGRRTPPLLLHAPYSCNLYYRHFNHSCLNVCENTSGTPHTCTHVLTSANRGFQVQFHPQCSFCGISRRVIKKTQIQKMQMWIFAPPPIHWGGGYVRLCVFICSILTTLLISVALQRH